MRRTVIILSFVALVGWGGWRLYEHPQVRDLFHDSGIATGPKSVWKIQTRNLPSSGQMQKKKTEPPGAPARRERAAAPAGAVQKVESPAADLPAQNSVANDVVTRVVLQILASRKLAYGIAISTSDTAIVVEGTVDSEEKRQQILDILERAREARRLDSQRLVVETKKVGYLTRPIN